MIHPRGPVAAYIRDRAIIERLILDTAGAGTSGSQEIIDRTVAVALWGHYRLRSAYTPQEAAIVLACAESLVASLIQQGRFPHVRRRKYGPPLIPWDDIVALMHPHVPPVAELGRDWISELHYPRRR